MERKTTPILGCVADDITGATDLAINLVQGGLRVVQVMEQLSADALRELDCDAIVVALKIRSVEPSQAVELGLAATHALKQAGCERFFFKYCSTFDSTPSGNIGPIAEAMQAYLGQQQTVFCPAFPRNGRTVYQGHLFVFDRLLCESGMQDHPLNPMRDADLRRVLAAQSKQAVGLVDFQCIERGAAAVSQRLRELENVAPLVILDSCSDKQLVVLAAAISEMLFVTGGSGIARFLPEAYREEGLVESRTYEPELPQVAGRSCVLSGSCSTATLRQVDAFQEHCVSTKINVARVLAESEKYRAELVLWASRQDPAKPVMFYSSSTAEAIDQLRQQSHAANMSLAIEQFQASLARGLADEAGVRRFVVAGGETSGAVAAGLGVNTLRIGPEICAGVPWTESVGDERFALAFKSGNFGDDSFFANALAQLDQ